MAGTTLCIVDMQPCFAASNKPKVLKGVMHQIRLAIRRKDSIVVVEYASCYSDEGHETHQCIMEQIINSKCRFTVIKKPDNDGGEEILNACYRHRYSTKRLRLCGVNRTACVYYTALGILYQQPETDVEVSWGATSDRIYEDDEKLEEQRGIDLYIKHPEIKIVN